MIPYIFCFSLSVILFKLNEKIEKGRQFVLTWVAILIPCLLAGLRDVTIGTDVGGYLKLLADAAFNARNFADYIDTNWYVNGSLNGTSGYEIGFVAVVYIVIKIFKSRLAVQFAIQLLTILPIYTAIKKMGYPKWLGMLVYYLFLFHSSLNVMRQHMAMAFVLLAWSEIASNESKKINRKCVIWTVVAISCHTSALIFVLIYWLYWMVTADDSVAVIGRKKYDMKSMKIFFISLISAVFVAFGVGTLVALLSALNLDKYVGYINGEIQFMPNQLIARFPMLVILAINWRTLFEKDKAGRFYVLMAALDLILSQFTSASTYGGRISMYFSQFQILSVGAVYRTCKNRNLMLIGMISYFIFYWWFYYVYKGSDQTIPYVLGI